MNKLYVGKVVGTHGIKGEIKVFSDVKIKERIFKSGTTLYFSDLNNSYEIENVRFHKNNYLVLLKGFNNINDVLFLLKKNVYVDRDIFLKKDEFVYEDLIGFEVLCDDKVYGKISDFEVNSSYATFFVEGDNNFYLPNVSEYVLNVDLKNKKVYTKNVGDLIL